uniref:UPAR/Ly6 domain-containing protein n=1 Tax=Monopterus albus TaxID=43700 RepID=A0A3Q3KDS5_MONAL
MKTVILALLVVLVVSQSEALKCNCGGARRCPGGRIETCSPDSDVCISAIIYAGSSVTSFRGCYPSSGCVLLNQPGISSASCCRTDLCNCL